MATSKLIAGLMGPLLLAIGAALFINRDFFPSMALEMARNQGLIFLSGILSLLAGVAVVRVHNIWSGGWPVIVTVLGWLAVIGGLVRMWFPQLAEPIATSVTTSGAPLFVAGLVNLALGGFLTYKAYQS
jgi:hypothetical protein